MHIYTILGVCCLLEPPLNCHELGVFVCHTYTSVCCAPSPPFVAAAKSVDADVICAVANFADDLRLCLHHARRLSLVGHVDLF